MRTDHIASRKLSERGSHAPILITGLGRTNEYSDVRSARAVDDGLPVVVIVANVSVFCGATVLVYFRSRVSAPSWRTLCQLGINLGPLGTHAVPADEASPRILSLRPRYPQEGARLGAMFELSGVSSLEN